MKRRIAVRGIVVHKGKLLCCKLKAYGERPATEYWCIPGGGVDEGEALIDALKREMIEETGITPKVGNLLYVQQFHKTQFEPMEEIEFFFHIINAPDYLNIKLDETSHGAEEIAEFAFIDPKTSYVLPKFLTTETHENLDNKPTRIFNYLD